MGYVLHAHLTAEQSDWPLREGTQQLSAAFSSLNVFFSTDDALSRFSSLAHSMAQRGQLSACSSTAGQPDQDLGAEAVFARIGATGMLGPIFCRLPLST